MSAVSDASKVFVKNVLSESQTVMRSMRPGFKELIANTNLRSIWGETVEAATSSVALKSAAIGAGVGAVYGGMTGQGIVGGALRYGTMGYVVGAGAALNRRYLDELTATYGTEAVGNARTAIGALSNIGDRPDWNRLASPGARADRLAKSFDTLKSAADAFKKADDATIAQAANELRQASLNVRREFRPSERATKGFSRIDDIIREAIADSGYSPGYFGVAADTAAKAATNETVS